MRQTPPGSRGLAILVHLIEMVGDPIYFRGRIFDRLGRAVRSLGGFVRGVGCLRGRLFRARSRLLRLRGGSLRLLSLLLVMRRASRDREDDNQRC